MKAQDISISKRRTPGRAAKLLLFFCGTAVVFAVLFLLFVGRWLVTEDPLEKAQAIVVLSGRMPLRALEAAKLYREGYAPEVWLTYSTEPGDTLRSLGISYVGEDSYDLQILTHEGVPSDAIHLLQPEIINTADEIAAVSAELIKEKGQAVILVTSKVHTRRVRILWHKLADQRAQAIVRGASDDSFEPGHWWRTTGDALDVVREILGILNVWAGMPLRPVS
jgi:uncharacterized SAM-binding protein YcdF (DUF218 family)